MDEPSIDLGKVVVHTLSHGLDGIGIRCRVEKAHLQLVVRLVRLHAQVVGLSRLELTGHECPKRAVLLVRPLVDCPALFVRVDRHRAIDDRGGRVHVRNGIEVGEVAAIGDVSLAQFLLARTALLVEANASADYGLRDLEVGTEVLGGGSVVVDAVPVVGGVAGVGVVVVLDIIRTADDVQSASLVRLAEPKQGGLFGCVVRFRFQDQGLGREGGDRPDRDGQSDTIHGRSDSWQRSRQRCQARIVRDRPEWLLAIQHGLDADRICARNWDAIDQMQVGIKGVQHLGPTCTGDNAGIAPIARESGIWQVRAGPVDFDPSVLRESRRLYQLQGHVECPALL